MKNENGNKTQRKPVKAIPEGLHSLTPYIIANNASAFIEFTKKAFGAQQTFIMKDDTGLIVHATIKIGDSTIMVSDVMKGMEAITCMLYLYVEDVDSVYKKAIDAKGSSIREPRDEFYGDRAGCVKDAWGNQWWISTHVEDVSDDELKRRKEQNDPVPS